MEHCAWHAKGSGRLAAEVLPSYFELVHNLENRQHKNRFSVAVKGVLRELSSTAEFFSYF